MVITGLIPAGQGYNKIIETCCPSTLKLKANLSPGQTNRNINRVLWNDTLSCGSTITYVDHIAYSDPLSTVFALTPLTTVDIEIDFCPCLGIGSTGQCVLTLDDQSFLIGAETFLFDFVGVDVTDVQDDLIPITSAMFTDCLNDCGRIYKAFTIKNPTALPVTITFTESTPTGLYYFLDGVNLPVGTFTIDANSSAEFQIQNPGCTVTPSDYQIAFDICGLATKTVDIYHRQVICGDCSLNCQGVSIITNPMNIETVPDPQNPNFGSNWLLLSASGFGSVSASYSTDLGDAWVTWNNINVPPLAGIDEGFFVLQSGSFYSYWFPPVTPISLDFEITIKFGAFNIPLLTPSLPPPIPYSIEFIPFSGTGFTQTYVTPFLQNTSYTITGTVPDFSYNSTGDFIGSLRIWIPEAQNGSTMYIDELSIQVKNLPIATVDLDCSTLDQYNFTAVGDYKEAIYYLAYANGFQSNVDFYFNPWLYSDNPDFSTKFPNGYGKPATGYVVTVDGTWIGDGLYHDMLPYNLGSNANNQKNWTVQIKLVDAYNFEIKFCFFIVEDLNNWVNNTTWPNHDKLIKTAPGAIDWVGVVDSVYLRQKALAAYFFIEDKNILTGALIPSPYYRCHFTRDVNFTARWWGNGLYGGMSEMSNPTWALSRGATTATDLSAVDATEVTFTVDFVDGVDQVVAWVFAINTNDNIHDFYYNYDSARSPIYDSVGTTPLNYHIIGPSQAPVNIGGTTYEVKFNVGPTVKTTHQYAIGVICYSKANNIINSFVRYPLTVSSLPSLGTDYNMGLLSTWQDYTQDYPYQCWTPTLNQRYIHKLQSGNGLNYMKDYIETTLGGSNWLDYLTRVDCNVYQRVNDYPVLGDSVYFMYYQETSTPTGANTFSSTPNFKVNIVGPYLLTEFNSRILYDGSTFNPNNVYQSANATAFDRRSVPQFSNVYISGNSVTNTWADKDIYHEYIFYFDLTSFGRGHINLVDIYTIHAGDYETTPTPYSSLMNALEVYGVTPSGNELITGQFCPSAYQYLLVKASGAGVGTSEFVAYLEPIPLSMPNLKEEESFVSPVGMVTLTATAIYDVDSNFASNEAYYKVNISNLAPGQYRLYGQKL